LINTLDENDLYDVIARYGEELHAKEIAAAIVLSRRRRSIETVQDLDGIVVKAINNIDTNKTLLRVFQALRIVTNHEFDNIRKGLNGALKVVKPGGKIAVITFHSLEDRIVKQFMRQNGLREHIKEMITGNKEISFERSAKLRVMVQA
jgi:16S rRNA (cytosine1402-N4)-methyltransferase